MQNAFLFPGQGSQFVGMGKEHYESNKRFAGFIDRSEEILGVGLKEIMFEGPEEQLRQTEFTQPAIFLHSVALFDQLEEQPDMVAGHSLGEFSALVAAQCLAFEDGLRLVRRRGELMQEAGEKSPGTMAAIIGMEDGAVEEICNRAASETDAAVVPANYNSPGQLVISGDVNAVETAVKLAREQGCRLAKVLPVSGAFHSPLMQSAYEELSEILQDTRFREPTCPIYSNYTAQPTIDPGEIQSNLLNQLLNPVRWTQTMKHMYENNARRFVEVGPGKVLQGLVKRTLDGVEVEGYQ